MRRPRGNGVWLALICTAAIALFGIAAPAQGAIEDPLFVFVPKPKFEVGKPPVLIPPPSGYLNGPCGLAVDGLGRFYVSDYYHGAVDLFNPPSSPFTDPPAYLGQLTGLDPLDGPCGLALDAANNLYVEDFHRQVAKFGPTPSFAPGPVFDTEEPTGVAVDAAAGRVYVDERTYIGVYDSTGAPVPDGEGHPLRIGVGTLGDGYGLALSQFLGTAGHLYVADAATDTVKAYDTATPGAAAVQTIAGPPGKAFSSLRDSALAVDWKSGDLYVVDDTEPAHTEQPRALVDVFDPTASYKGHLKYEIVDARPPGLAVDNSGGASQGRVYVTSGNTSEAGIYAYPPGAATSSDPLPPSVPLSLGASGGGSGDSALANASASAPAPSKAPRATASTISQKGTLRVAVNGRLSPRRLPRAGLAPIAVSVAGQITTTDQSLPPQLKSLRIELNRHGRLDFDGLPTCTYDRIQPASSSRALAACRPALVGQGSFSADITLAGQEPYPTSGKLLLFNGRRHGKPVLYGQIYAPRPFATSFVIVFAVQKLPHGIYGTALSAPLPKAMEAWGRLTALQMTLSRSYRYRGERHSYISSGCPAPKGFGLATFPLARTAFSFAAGGALSNTVTERCRVR